jgi:hypothetical protein
VRSRRSDLPVVGAGGADLAAHCRTVTLMPRAGSSGPRHPRRARPPSMRDRKLDRPPPPRGDRGLRRRDPRVARPPRRPAGRALIRLLGALRRRRRDPSFGMAAGIRRARSARVRGDRDRSRGRSVSICAVVPRASAAAARDERARRLTAGHLRRRPRHGLHGAVRDSVAAARQALEFVRERTLAGPSPARSTSSRTGTPLRAATRSEDREGYARSPPGREVARCSRFNQRIEPFRSIPRDSGALPFFREPGFLS